MIDIPKPSYVPSAPPRKERRMTKYIELIDKYEIRQSDSDDYNPPSYIWTANTGELIRCKDCKYCRQTEAWDRVERWCAIDADGIFIGRPLENDEGFCSWAERKEE